MRHAFAARFDMTGNLKFFEKLFGNQTRPLVVIKRFHFNMRHCFVAPEIYKLFKIVHHPKSKNLLNLNQV